MKIFVFSIIYFLLSHHVFASSKHSEKLISDSEIFSAKVDRAFNLFYAGKIQTSLASKFYLIEDGDSKKYEDLKSNFTYDFEFVKNNLYGGAYDKKDEELYLCARIAHLIDIQFEKSEGDLDSFYRHLKKLYDDEYSQIVTIVGGIANYAKLKIKGKMPRLKFIGDSLKDWAALFMMRALKEGTFEFRNSQKIIITLIEKALENNNREMAYNLYLAFNVYIGDEYLGMRGEIFKVRKGNKITSNTKNRFRAINKELGKINRFKEDYKRVVEGRRLPLTHVMSMMDNLGEYHSNWNNSFEAEEDIYAQQLLDEAMYAYHTSQIEEIKVRNSKRREQRIRNLPPLDFSNKDESEYKYNRYNLKKGKIKKNKISKLTEEAYDTIHGNKERKTVSEIRLLFDNPNK